MCQHTSQMCPTHQTWKPLANANVCRGWCTCVKPVKCKKGVAPGRCVSATSAHVHLHQPTVFEIVCIPSFRRWDCPQRYAHEFVHPCLCNCNTPKKVCWLRRGVFVDAIIFGIELSVIVVCISLHFWRLGATQVPIGTLRKVWTLTHQLVQIALNLPKDMFKKAEFGPVA